MDTKMAKEPKYVMTLEEARKRLPVHMLIPVDDMILHKMPFLELWTMRDLPNRPRCMHCEKRYTEQCFQPGHLAPRYFAIEIADKPKMKVTIIPICEPCVMTNYRNLDGSPIVRLPPLKCVHPEPETVQ